MDKSRAPSKTAGQAEPVQVTGPEGESPVHREWERILDLPGLRPPDPSVDKLGSVITVIGGQLREDLVSDDRTRRARAEELLLADTVAKNTLFTSVIDGLIGINLSENKTFEKDMPWIERLFALRERLARGTRETLQTREALRRPGPVNVQFRSEGHQQVNIGPQPVAAEHARSTSEE